jgi:transcriptional regulator with XRE-family HTH domain
MTTHSKSLDAVSERIRAVRVAKCWSQEELAAASGLSRDAISRIERGDRQPSLDALARIATALGVTLAMLVDVSQPLPRKGTSVGRTPALHLSPEPFAPWIANALVTAIRTIAEAAAKERKRRPGPRRKRLQA